MSDYKKTALVLGAGGFIGSHMVKRLRSEGYWVRGVDLKRPEYSETEANEYAKLKIEWWGSNLIYVGCDELEGYFYPKFNVWD